MYKEQKIAVAIPCYKVEQHLEQVVSGLPPLIDIILLVDDCSPDGTPALVDRLADGSRIVAIHHPQNKGVGGAMKTAFRKAMEMETDVVVKLDGDGQMDASYIAPLVEALEGADFAKGNRLFTAEDMDCLKQIHLLVKEQGLTLEGASKKLAAERKAVDGRVKALDSLKEIRKQLVEVKKSL